MQARSNLKRRHEQYQESSKKIKAQADADILLASETFAAHNWTQMTIAQQQFATANAQLHEMSQAMEAVKDTKMVAMRKMESAETSAGIERSSNAIGRPTLQQTAGARP